MRVLTINCRLFSLNKTGHPWGERLAPFLAMLDRTQPDVIAVQECDQEDQVPTILAHLGKSWRFYMLGKVGWLYDSARFKYLQGIQHNMPNGGEADRRLVAVQLESRATRKALWYVSVHLGVNFADPDGDGPLIGEKQARLNQAGEIVKKMLGRECVVAGDFNESARYPTPGVRTVLQDGLGAVELRAKAAVVGAEHSTFNGWGPTKTNGRWLDDILTTVGVSAVAAEVVPSDPAAPYSDHNAVLAELVY